METIYQSIVMACLIILSACAITFPILFLAQLKKLRKELIEALNDRHDEQ